MVPVHHVCTLYFASSQLCLKVVCQPVISRPSFISGNIGQDVLKHFKFKIFEESKQLLFSVPLGMSEMNGNIQGIEIIYCGISRGNLVDIASNRVSALQIRLLF